MFLALNEIKYDKTRFALIIGVVFLISYLVYFLTGLAYGLATSYTNAVDRWNADGLIYSKDVNDNISMSMLKLDVLDDISGAEKAYLASAPAIIKNSAAVNEAGAGAGAEDAAVNEAGAGAEDAAVNEATAEPESLNANIFGVDSRSFIAPKIAEGRMFAGDDEVVADISLKEDGFKIGDYIEFSGDFDEKVKITGFTQNATFQVAPVLYGSLDFFQNYRYRRPLPAKYISAVVVRAAGGDLEKISVKNSALKIMPISDFVFKLPGYSAQVMTFSLMIGFLIVIAALIIGIFIYVLTIQKINMFGVMKAGGVSNGYINRYVIAKTMLVSGIGVLLGLGLTVFSSFALPVAVPFLINWIFFAVITAAFMLVSVLGGMFSVRMVTRVDPLIALQQ